MQQVVYLQPDDDLPAIRHLLEGAQARRVLLVLPGGYSGLRDPLSLRLLRRKATELALEVALVTRDGRIREMAREEGVATVLSESIGRWDLWRSELPARSEAHRAAARRVNRLRQGRRDPGYTGKAHLWLGRVLALVVFALLVTLVAGMAALTVPEARISVVPYRESVETTLQLVADPEATKSSLADLTIPARIVEVEVEQVGETPTLEKRDAPDAPAKGTVLFINEAATARDIVTGTLVRTSTGTTVRFKTVAKVSLEGRVGATVLADIEALEPGPVGNVAAATINTVETAELRGKVRVINEKATAGGGVKQVGVVTRADMDKLKGVLLEQLEQRAFGQLQGLLVGQEFLPAESMTIEILSEVYDQFLDAQADTLKLTMRIYAAGTAVDGAQARLLAEQSLKAKIPSSYMLESEEIAFRLDDEVQIDGRKVLLVTEASAALVTDVDRGQVRSLAAGLEIEEAVRVLSDTLTLGAPPAIVVEPEWIKRFRWLDRVPYLPFRIQVLVLR
jgi:hypothetical protein